MVFKIVALTVVVIVVVVVVVVLLHCTGGGGGSNYSVNSTSTSSSTMDICFLLYINPLLHNLELQNNFFLPFAQMYWIIIFPSTSRWPSSFPIQCIPASCLLATPTGGLSASVCQLYCCSTAVQQTVGIAVCTAARPGSELRHEQRVLY